MTGDVRGELEEALRAVGDGQLERALDSLLAAWRARRAPVLADLIDGVSERIGAPSIDVPAAEWHAAWLAREEARRPADLGALLRALAGPPDGSGKWIHAFQRLEKLETWPADPRMSAGLVAIIETQPLDSRAAPFYRIAMRLLVGLGDARALSALRILAGRARDLTVKIVVDEMIADLEKALAGGTPALTAEEETLAGAVRDACRQGGPGLDDLLARVYDSPDDDAACAAYAEALVARGDPRGGYILRALRRHAGETLPPEEEERDARLLEANKGKWLGPLEALIGSVRVRFERGFPVSGSVHPSYEVAALLRGHPAWSTLRELSFEVAPPDFVHPVFRNLRVANRASDEHLITFATTEAGASLEELVWRGPLVDLQGQMNEAVLRALADPAAFPRLRRLRFHPMGTLRFGAKAIAALLDTPVFRRVEVLGCASGVLSLAEWLEALGGRESSLSAAEIEITPSIDIAVDYDVVLRIGRGEMGRFAALRAVIEAPSRDERPILARRRGLSALCRMLQCLPLRALNSLHIEGDRAAEPEPEQIEELKRAMWKFELDGASLSEMDERVNWVRARGARPPDVVEAEPEDWARLAREHLSRLGVASIPVQVDPYQLTIGDLVWSPWSGRSLDVAGSVVDALCAAAMLLEPALVPLANAASVERGREDVLATLDLAAPRGVLGGPKLVVDGDRLAVDIEMDGWPHPHRRGLVTARCGSVPVDRLPRAEARLAEVAGRLRTAATAMQTTVRRTCRFCLGTFEPVDMHDRTVCHSCSEAWLGVRH